MQWSCLLTWFSLPQWVRLTGSLRKLSVAKIFFFFGCCEVYTSHSFLDNANNEQQLETVFISVTDSIISAGRQKFFSKFRMRRKRNNDVKNVQNCKNYLFPNQMLYQHMIPQQILKQQNHTLLMRLSILYTILMMKLI